MNARTTVTLLISATLAIAPLAACGSSGASSSGGKQEEQQTGVANPFVDCESAYEAAQLAGFDVTFPESVPGYSERKYQAVEGQMVQCIYSAGDSKVLIRKGLGYDDISGDYNEYPNVNTAEVRGIEVIEKGDDKGVHVATWTLDGFTFAIDADEGLEASVVEDLVTSLM